MTQLPHEVIPEWTLGDRLRKARTLTGLTVREFADRIGVSHMTVTNAEKDARAVRTITLRAWAMATGVPIEWLRTGAAPVKPTPPVGDGEYAQPEGEAPPVGLEPTTLRSPARRLHIALERAA